jgi:hypothetical protein
MCENEPELKLKCKEDSEKEKNRKWRTEMQALRGILKGIDTSVLRESDRKID